MILDPDTTQQDMLLFSTTGGDTIENPVAEVYRDGALLFAETPQVDSAGRPSGNCLYDRYRFGYTPSGTYDCFQFDFVPQGGEVYEVVVRANGRPTARAQTVVPGPFTIDSARIRGSPPGTDLVEGWWSESAGAFRYLVGLRVDSYCLFLGCGDLGFGEEKNAGWFETTDATHIRTTAPYEQMYGVQGDIFVDVYALDEALYRFLNTGNADDRFPVPPVQNVENGYGAVGSWRRISLQVVESDTIGG